MVHVSRAPIRPLKDSNRSILGELFLKEVGTEIHIMYKSDSGSIIDIFKTYLDPAFNKLSDEFRNKLVSGRIQNYKPENGESFWFKTEKFESVIDDDEQL